MDKGTVGETERLGVLTGQLRTSINTANAALEAIKSGRVGIAGSTGTLLDRSLASAHDLIERLAAEVYLPKGTKPLS
jgi:hypothetical protein